MRLQLGGLPNSALPAELGEGELERTVRGVPGLGSGMRLTLTLTLTSGVRVRVPVTLTLSLSPL